MLNYRDVNLVNEWLLYFHVYFLWITILVHAITTTILLLYIWTQCVFLMVLFFVPSHWCLEGITRKISYYKLYIWYITHINIVVALFVLHYKLNRFWKCSVLHHRHTRGGCSSVWWVWDGCQCSCAAAVCVSGWSYHWCHVDQFCSVWIQRDMSCPHKRMFCVYWDYLSCYLCKKCINMIFKLCTHCLGIKALTWILMVTAIYSWMLLTWLTCQRCPVFCPQVCHTETLLKKLY